MTVTSLEREIEVCRAEILERYEEVNGLYRLSECFRDVFDERRILGAAPPETALGHASAGWFCPDSRGISRPASLDRGRRGRENASLAARTIAEPASLDGDEDPRRRAPLLLSVPL
jgi:hypothetical protein